MACAHCGATHEEDDERCARTGRPLAEPGPCGQTVDRYQIESLLQTGGFGAVYCARHIHTRREVAVKILEAELASDATMLLRFKREAQAIAAIESPHVVQVFDWGVLPTGEAYLAMELLRGGDLRSELGGHGRIELARALAIEHQIFAALRVAHARGIIHRDLKPANVFLVATEAGALVKLIDFGISKVTGARDALRTNTGTSMGTQGYMAPEQIRGAAVDERIDVYAAGVVLYEMLAGELPHAATSYEDYVVRVCTEPARPIRELAHEVPEAVAAAIMKALEAEPARRWASIDAFADAVDPEHPFATPIATSDERPTSHDEPTVAEQATQVDPTTQPTRAERSSQQSTRAERTTRERSSRWPAIAIIAGLAATGVVVWRVAAAKDGALDDRVVIGAVAPLRDAATVAPLPDAASVPPDATTIDAAAVAPAVKASATWRLDAMLAARKCHMEPSCPIVVCECAQGQQHTSMCSGSVCSPSARACAVACSKAGGWTGKATDGAALGLARSEADCMESSVCATARRCVYRDGECVR